MIEKIDFNTLDERSLREYAKQLTKNFKTGWVDLGRILFTIWKNKHYKEWGHLKFETYIAKEIGIRKQTAVKLLRSYGYLEREKPDYLRKDFVEGTDAKNVAGYESIDILRSASRSKKLNDDEYKSLKEQVFLKGKDAQEVRKDLTALIKQRDELDPEEAWSKRKESNVKRFIGLLKSLKRDMEASKMIKPAIANEITKLITKLESELR